jgi:hypothetical protein
LEDTGADDMAQGCLSALDEGLADVGDAKGGLVWGGDAVVDYGCELKGDVVLCYAELLGDLCTLVSAPRLCYGEGWRDTYQQSVS